MKLLNAIEHLFLAYILVALIIMVVGLVSAA